MSLYQEIVHNDKTGFIVYPNPANEQVFVDYKMDKTVSGLLVITDLTGRIVVTKILPGSINHVSLNTATINSGTYLYSIYANGLQQKNQKLVIIK